MDLSKLSNGDKVIAGSGIAYLIFMFFPWYGVSGGGNRNGWDYFLFGIIPLLLAILMVVVVLLPQLSPSTTLPKLPVPYSQGLLGAGGLAAFLVLLRLLLKDSAGVLGFTVDLDRKFGLFVAFLAAAGLAVGAYLKFQAKEEPGESAAGGGAAPTSF